MQLKKYLNKFNFDIKNFLKAFVVLIVSFLLSYSFFQLGFKNETILMVFLTGVLIIVIETHSYLAGFVSSVIYVFTYNFFFTKPFHTFKIEDVTNIISLVIFFIVCVIAGVLTSKLQKQMKLSVELEKANAQIEKEKTKSMLLRSISHDLRTPLTSIAGSSNFLSENYDKVSKEDAIELLQDVEKNARSLTDMIENLLNMTRIQDGRLIIEKNNEVLDDLISNAIERVCKKNYCVSGENKTQNNRIIIEETSQILVCQVDGRLITQVFSNIIDNAFKHNDENVKVKIKVDLLKYDCDDGNVKDKFETLGLNKNLNYASIKIKDNGKGIPNELTEKIFDTFFTIQKDNSSTDSTRGLGLGLSICKTIINSHGGKIFVYNNKTGGACFEILLPE